MVELLRGWLREVMTFMGWNPAGESPSLWQALESLKSCSIPRLLSRLPCDQPASCPRSEVVLSPIVMNPPCPEL